MKKKNLFFVLVILFFSSCAAPVTYLIDIPEGFFVMGSNQGEEDEQPEKNIFLSQFSIDAYEVTVAQYNDCVNAGECNYPLFGEGFFGDKEWALNYPINGVSWFDANNYCEYVGKRLPTEAEWERAASWVDDKKYNYSNARTTITCAEANINGLSGACPKEPIQVGSFGVELNSTFDMTGNLWEWVADWYNPNEYQKIQERDPKGATEGLLKVNRGGSYLSTIKYARTTFRGANPPVLRSTDIGFRCASDGENE